MQEQAQQEEKRFWPIFTSLGILHLASRLFALTALPMFSDETMFLRWAQLIRQGHPFVSFEVYNIKPLFVWLTALVWPLFDDPLLAGRLLNVCSGLLALYFVFRLAWALGGKRLALVAGLLYLLTPYTLFHDRLAMYDSLTTALAAASFYFAWRMVADGKRSGAVGFGIATGLGLINKEMAYFFPAYPPMILFALWWVRREVKWKRTAQLIGSGWALALAILLLTVAYPLWKYGHGLFHSTQYFLTTKEIFSWPVDQWQINWQRIFSCYRIYLGPVLPLMAVIGFVLSWRNRRPEGLALGLAWLIPAAVIFVVAKQFYSRYLLFTVPAMVLVGSLFVQNAGEWLAKKLKTREVFVFGLLTVLAIVFPLRLFAQIMINPLRAELWLEDRKQYVEDWTSGFGADQILARLQNEAQSGPVTVFVAPHHGLFKDALLLYLRDEPNIDIRPVEWVLDKPVLSFMDAKQPVYNREEPYLRDGGARWLDPAQVKRALFVLSVPQMNLRSFIQLNPKVRPLLELGKPGDRSFFAILELPLE